MSTDLFWFWYGPDAEDAAFWRNHRLQLHLLGYGFSEGAD